MPDTPAPDQPAGPATDLETQLAEANGRADHFARLLTALVATSGPVQITATAYNAADPAALLDMPAFAGSEPAIMFALPEQVAAIVGRFAGPPPGEGVDAV